MPARAWIIRTAVSYRVLLSKPEELYDDVRTLDVDPCGLGQCIQWVILISGRIPHKTSGKQILSFYSLEFWTVTKAGVLKSIPSRPKVVSNSWRVGIVD
jgi:hypothetical protein